MVKDRAIAPAMEDRLILSQLTILVPATRIEIGSPSYQDITIRVASAMFLRRTNEAEPARPVGVFLIEAIEESRQRTIATGSAEGIFALIHN